jgi:hypothetical protein
MMGRVRGGGEGERLVCDIDSFESKKRASVVIVGGGGVWVWAGWDVPLLQKSIRSFTPPTNSHDTHTKNGDTKRRVVFWDDRRKNQERKR